MSIRAALVGEGRVWGVRDQKHGSVTDSYLVCNHWSNVAFCMPNNGHEVSLKSSVVVISKSRRARKVMVMD